MEVMSAADLERRVALRKMKVVATGLLGTRHRRVLLRPLAWRRRHDWVGYIRAFAEAAMVGALADWFAVSALFRHPLGIPIPHTAIIPHRKDQIGRSLGEFVQTNFLTREVLNERLAGANVGKRLGDWMADEQQRRQGRRGRQRPAARRAGSARRPRCRICAGIVDRASGAGHAGGAAGRQGHRPRSRGRTPPTVARRGAEGSAGFPRRQQGNIQGAARARVAVVDTRFDRRQVVRQDLRAVPTASSPRSARIRTTRCADRSMPVSSPSRSDSAATPSCWPRARS